ncbi:MAG TPA: sulfatase-like hydrolase/transferase [Bacillota bacterium]|nr:sulfatase-like hydrolase/transferase [Bacillota bacterium]
MSTIVGGETSPAAAARSPTSWDSPLPPPNLDKLAAQGIRFTQGCVASPICSASRTGVLTGIEPARYSFLNDKASNAAHHMADWV